MPFSHKNMKVRSQFTMRYSRSVNEKNFKKVGELAGSTIGTTMRHVSVMPEPKKKPKKKVKEEPKPPAEVVDPPKDENGNPIPAEPVKKPRVVKKPPPPMMPIHEPLPAPAELTVPQALKSAVGWSNSNMISKKFSVGTLTTVPYDDKVRVFQNMNTLAEEKSAVLPMSNFQRKHKINPDKDRFDRRVVKQLCDISFDSDSDDESLRTLKRLPITVLNVENLRSILSTDTIRLNLENHYWLPN